MPALRPLTRTPASFVVVKTTLSRYGSFAFDLKSVLQYVVFFVNVIFPLSADIAPSAILNGPVPIICLEQR